MQWCSQDFGDGVVRYEYFNFGVNVLEGCSWPLIAQEGKEQGEGREMERVSGLSMCGMVVDFFLP